MKAFTKIQLPNLRGETLAAALIEHGSYRTEDIQITAVGDFERGLKPDVAEVKPDSKHNKLKIAVRRPKWASLAGGQIVASLTEPLWPVIEAEAFRFRLEIELRERKHQLGSSPTMEAYFGLEEVNEENRRAWMAYLLTHASTISERDDLLGWALGKLLGQPVEVVRAKPETQTVGDDSFNIDNWRVGISTAVVGEFETVEAPLEIRIGPMDRALLRQFLPGGEEHGFLEWALPRLLPKAKKLRVVLLPKAAENGFELPEDEGALVGYATINEANDHFFEKTAFVGVTPPALAVFTQVHP